MTSKWYGRNDGSIVLSATLHALLTEDGQHVYKLAFDKYADTSRNFIFGVIVTHKEPDTQVSAWDTQVHAEPHVHLCYELCEAFPLYEDSAEYKRLQQTVQRILRVDVRLIPFTHFQRSIGEYAGLHPIFAKAQYAAVFRHDIGSLLDDKMHVVLSCWQASQFACPVLPPLTQTSAPHTLAKSGGDSVAESVGEWNSCFRSIASVFWYHEYVYEVIGQQSHAQFGLCNVMRTYDAVCANSGSDLRGKLALLDVLKLAYRYNYDTT
jgi:hypothetical protein